MENKKSFVYVVSIVGKDVSGGWCVQCVMVNKNDFDKVRTMIEEQHNIAFEKKPWCSKLVWQIFDNISDDRDIILIVERIKLII